MKPMNKLLTLAIAAALVGCASGPEKQADPMAMEAEQPVEKVGGVAEPDKAETQTPVVSAPSKSDSSTAKKSAKKEKKTYKLPSDPNTFLVTVEEKSDEHPFHGRGLANGFVVNGQEGKEVVAVRGNQYKFQVDTGVQHDFYLTTSPVGWGAGTYTDGVEGQFIFKGEVKFKPGKNTPDLLYYQCRNHKYMGGKIYVADKGENIDKLKASLATKEETLGGKKRATSVVTAGAVKQKLGYANMVISSDSAKRVEASGNAEAIGMLKSARAQIESAKKSLSGNQHEEAMNQVNEGLRLMAAASRAITSESDMAGVDHKAKYNEMLDSLKTYETSYERNMKRAKKMKQKPKTTLDEGEYKKLVNEGKSLAGKKDYAKANKSLEKAQAMITSVLTTMLHAQTVTYDKSFETPKEEYEFELARVENYEELIPLAIEQKQPSKTALDLIDGFVKKAAKIKSEGKGVAAKGDYKMAILAMQAATSNLQRALRIAGVN